MNFSPWKLWMSPCLVRPATQPRHPRPGRCNWGRRCLRKTIETKPVQEHLFWRQDFKNSPSSLSAHVLNLLWRTFSIGFISTYSMVTGNGTCGERTTFVFLTLPADAFAHVEPYNEDCFKTLGSALLPWKQPLTAHLDPGWNPGSELIEFIKWNEPSIQSWTMWLCLFVWPYKIFLPSA